MKRLLALFLALLCILPAGIMEDQDALPGEQEVVVVTSEGRPLKYGDKGEDVKLLQTRLKDLRYYNGPVTGNYLEVTRKAIRAVQEAYGLPVNGEADLELQEIIYGDAHRPLKKGERGKEVERLQTRLSEIGYYWGKITGNYLDGTTAAVGHFQEDNGIKKTGQADVQTLIKLYSDDIVMPTPDPNTTPKPIPTPPADAQFAGIVSYGSKTKQVSLIQERLTALGFFDRKITGGYYEHTHAAVKKFQQYNGLVADGVVGEQTWNVLFSLDVVRADGIPKPTPEPVPNPYFVEVDVNNQLIKVYGLMTKNHRIEKIFTCSLAPAAQRGGHPCHHQRRARWAEFPTGAAANAGGCASAPSAIIYNSYDLKSVNMKAVRAGQANPMAASA